MWPRLRDASTTCFDSLGSTLSYFPQSRPLVPELVGLRWCSFAATFASRLLFHICTLVPRANSILLVSSPPSFPFPTKSDNFLRENYIFLCVSFIYRTLFIDNRLYQSRDKLEPNQYEQNRKTEVSETEPRTTHHNAQSVLGRPIGCRKENTGTVLELARNARHVVTINMHSPPFNIHWTMSRIWLAQVSDLKRGTLVLRIWNLYAAWNGITKPYSAVISS